MAKKVKTPVSREMTRKQVARVARDRRNQNILLGITGAVVVLVIGVIVFGFINEVVIRGQQPVAEVNGVKIPTRDFQARVRWERYQLNVQLFNYSQQQQSLDPTDPSSESYLQQLTIMMRNLENQLSAENAGMLGQSVLDQLTEEELVRQECERRDIAVSEDELLEQIGMILGVEGTSPAADTITNTETLTDTVQPTPVPPTPDQIEEAYDRFFDAALKDADVTKKQFESWIMADMLRTQLQEAIGETVETVADQVQISYLNFEAEEAAQIAAERLAAGEDFVAVKEELTAGDEPVANGADLGWWPVGYLNSQYGREIESAAFNTPVGSATDPLMGQDGRWYVLYVQGHEERELDPYVLYTAQQEAYDNWLEAQRQELVTIGTWEDRVPTEP